jgi:hypothetical protein
MCDAATPVLIVAVVGALLFRNEGGVVLLLLSGPW